ncbi:MAG: 5-oxoprolinase subunit PxpB [Gilvibacter sp.]
MIQPTFRIFGEHAILIEWPFKIQEEGHAQLLTYRKLLALFNESIVETVVTYNSIAIYLKPKVDQLLLIEKIKSTISLASITIDKQIKIWEVPCCYDAEFAIDSEAISNHCKLDFDACVALHIKTPYRIYFHGFLPGFLYLGGLDAKLHVPRRATPRAKVAKGSVAIGGMQTGIYPMQSPGGWNILGSTPINLFDASNAASPSPFRAGDYLQFKAISKRQFDAISGKVAKGKYKLKYTLKDD